MKTVSFARATASVLLLSLVLVACGDNPEKMVASAKEFLVKNDNKAAVIQLKNALQANPSNAEARFLLGKALYASGDAVGAEAELRKARDLKYAEADVVPLLARALLAQGQFRKVTDELAKLDLPQASAKADLLTTVAAAWAGQKKPDASQAALAAALQAQPDFAPALLVQARQKAAQRDMDGALAIADGVLAKAPKDDEALKLKGDILMMGKNQPSEALALYRQAVQAKPNATSARFAILMVLLQEGKLDEAATELEALKKVAGGHPQTKFFATQLAYQKKDFKAARALAQDLMKTASASAPVLQIAGAVEYQLNSFVQAEAYLAKAVQAAPGVGLARRLLILTYLRTGQIPKALAALPPDLEKSDSDSEMLTVAGQAYLQSGDVARAQALFARATKLDPKDPRKRTSLAMTRMMSGQTEAAFGELQEIAQSDSGTTADFALISAHLQRKEFDKALAGIDALGKKKPNDPQVPLLRGRTLLAKQDPAGARKSFEQSLTLDPSFFASVAALASMDMADKKPQDARKRFEAVLEKNPKHLQALMALAELAARTGAPKAEVATLIGKAVEANPTEATAHLLLIEFHLGDKNPKKALEAAQNALAALPDNPELLDALGRVQVLANDANQAVITYNKLAALQPLSPQPQLRLAGVHMALKNPEAAAQSLRRALDIKPDLLEAQRGLANLAIQRKSVPDALAISRDIQKQRPKELAGYALEGDVQASQKNWEQAAAAYRAGLKQVAAPELAIKLHAALLNGGKKADADKMVAEWQRDNPKDPAVPFYLGDRAMTASDYALADKHYQQVLKLQPNNAVAYNNLAWVAQKLGKDGAQAYAEKANALTPNQPAFMDTLALLLSDKGEHAKALELQKKAIALQPATPLFKLTLAKIQIKAGDKTGAKSTLDELTKLGDKFSGQTEVEKLRKGL